ncbi:DUF4131 domain-containing protein [Sphingomonas lacunae]|uniref:DUF4131 domain-containing protein n=1 Tax=Sphingomonas lacunae TaxID=2698828 RepID=A0A6M4AWS0_9SPHN|nr:ComEC/Rec2 family competence protein [Sphingomonas lacunae]QJQ32820.1 DUF4131 domain-containing protein [Sphingomonas lacunae]
MTGAVHQTGIWAGLRDVHASPAAWLRALDAQLWTEREQLVLWIPILFGTGIALWFILPGTQLRLSLVFLALALALIGWLLGATERLTGRALLVAGLALAAGCATIWWKNERVAAPVLAKPAISLFSAEVLSVELLASREQVRLMLKPDAGQALPPKIRVSVPWESKGARSILPDDRIRLRARLVPPPRAALPGGYDFARRAWFEQIGAVGSAIGPVERINARQESGPGLRARLSAHIQTQVAGGPGAIAAAFATGDRGAISAEDDEAMRRSGLAHLLSISGLHVTAAVGGAMWMALRLLALSPWLALRFPLVTVSAGCGALVGLGYTLLTGGEIPTVRSLLAALLVLLALVLGRDAITLRLIGAGAMVVLLLWPEALVGPSFQLSFAAVTAIVALHSSPRAISWFSARDEGWLRKFGRTMASLFLTGLVVELALIPIGLFHFHKTGLYGAAANIVAIPLTTFIVMPAEALALALDSVGLGAPAWWVVEQSLALLLFIAHFVANAPGATANLPAMPRGAFGLMLAGGLWLLIWTRPWRWWGAVPFVLGAVWALSITPPDLLITGDGRHVAVRTDDGRYVLLRDRAGEFVRDQLAEAAGIDEELASLAEQPGVRCSPDFCVWTMERAGRRWSVMASRSGYRTDWEPLVKACAEVDIVIADRWLPRACQPRWLKADQKALRETGGLTIRLDPPSVEAVAASWRGMPWGQPPTIMPPRRGQQEPPAERSAAGTGASPQW